MPARHWAIQRRSDDRGIGGAVLLPLPPGNPDLEIGWHLYPVAGMFWVDGVFVNHSYTPDQVVADRAAGLVRPYLARYATSLRIRCP